jgi:hypothetical protein
MNHPDCAEIITLLIPGEEPRTLSLADAVRLVIHTEDHVKRVAATILRDRGEPIGRAQMERIYGLPDFPRSSSSN